MNNWTERGPLSLMSWFASAALFLVTFGVFAESLVSELKSDEQIIFHPSLAWPSHESGWNVRMHGKIFEQESVRLTLAVLRAALRLEGIQMSDDESALFKERARLFFADNERGHRVVARVGTEIFDLGESAPNGHFEREIHLAELPDENASNPTVLNISAVLEEDDPRQFTGIALLMSTNGVSVVSDIDDTIKLSEVRDRQVMLRRTFLEPFEAVPGMAEVYRRWATNGASFHYVSASPWQLFQPLHDFLGTNGFPPGSWSMKQWRIKDRTFDALFDKPEGYKVETIAPLLRQFPERRFVLVGDSGERDPEAYAALARKFPKQVVAIFIRDVTEQGADAERYRTNFATLPDDLWRIFHEPSEIAPLLPVNEVQRN